MTTYKRKDQIARFIGFLSEETCPACSVTGQLRMHLPDSPARSGECNNCNLIWQVHTKFVGRIKNFVQWKIEMIVAHTDGMTESGMSELIENMEEE